MRISLVLVTLVLIALMLILVALLLVAVTQDTTTVGSFFSALNMHVLMSIAGAGAERADGLEAHCCLACRLFGMLRAQAPKLHVVVCACMQVVVCVCY